MIVHRVVEMLIIAFEKVLLLETLESQQVLGEDVGFVRQVLRLGWGVFRLLFLLLDRFLFFLDSELEGCDVDRLELRLLSCWLELCLFDLLDKVLDAARLPILSFGIGGFVAEGGSASSSCSSICN